MNELTILKTQNPKNKPDFNNLGFGKHFSDHMFVMDYSNGKWHSPRIEPYGPMLFDPSIMVLHYGQAIFEGLKAYRDPEGAVLLFRPHENIRRLNRSNERMCIPQIDEDFVLSAMEKLIQVDSEWVPNEPGTSLYIRPIVFATDSAIGVSPSSTYRFMIITCPVGPYYKEGFNPIKIYVETEYVRAIRGGVGHIKTIGNYAASLKAQLEAHGKNYSQVLWLDGVERKYVEEVGTMNIFFVIDDKVVTPPLEGSILPGVTRDSVIALLKKWGIPVEERRISIEEVYKTHQLGQLKEVFGTGTAAVISSVGELNWKGKIAVINNSQIGSITSRVFDTLTGLQTGKIKDELKWIVKVPVLSNTVVS